MIKGMVFQPPSFGPALDCIASSPTAMGEREGGRDRETRKGKRGLS